MSNTITKAVARRFVTAHNKVTSALGKVDATRVTAAGVVADILTDAPRGSAARLAELSEVEPGTISKYSALAKALALVPDASDEDKQALARSIFDGKGDRKAVQEAVKAGNGAAAVKAAHAEPAKSTGKGKGSKSTGTKAVALKDMPTEALIALLAEATEVLATRDDMPGANADRFAKYAKSAGVIARNLQKVPVS